ncbi:MAG: uroporphyrinogen decarboxylase family protein [Candidatus Bathyarchaeia archaeon]
MLTAVKLEEPERVPVATLEQEHAVKLAGVKYWEYATDPKIVAKAQMHAIRKYRLDFAWIHIDDWIEYEAMGNKIRYFDAAVPTCERYVVEEESDLGKLRIPDPSRDGRIPVLIEAIKAILKASQGRILVCGRAASAFSGMLLLRGLEKGLKDLYVNPKLCEDLLKISHEVAETMATAQIEAGAHAIWVGDCLATSRLIPPRFHELYALPYQSKLISLIKKLGGIPILFTDEKKLDRLIKESESNPDVMGIGTGIKLEDAKQAIGEKLCLFGNIDPVHALLQGSKEDVAGAVRSCIEAAASGGGFILATGECVCRDTPESNIHEMVKQAETYGRYKAK